MDIELIMEALGEAGVTTVIKCDHERSVLGGKPWTLVMSGLALGSSGPIHTDSRSLQDCLEFGFRELRKRPGNWDWLELLS